MEACSLILAIDGGQTSTGVWVLSSDLRMSEYRTTRGFTYATESANSEPQPTQTDCIIKTICALLGKVGKSYTHISTIIGSFSGLPSGLSEQLHQVFPQATFAVLQDSEAAYLGSLWQLPGVSLISGTGSVAVASDGMRKRSIGGWGYMFGDNAGGWGIVRNAISAATCSAEGYGNTTELVESLLTFFDVPSFRTLAWDYYNGKRPRHQLGMAALLILKLAEEGDFVAQQVANEAAAELAGYVLAGSRIMNLGSNIKVGYSGGVLTRSKYLRHLTETRLHQTGTVVEWLPGSALAGSALWALKTTGVEITTDIRENVAALATAFK